LYSAGDMLPGSARLAEIEATRVILTRSGAREELAFKSDFKAKEAVQAASVAQQQARPTTPASTESQALQQLNVELAQNPDETLQKMGVSRRSEGGYRIGSAANQPFLAQSGLQPGDVVLSVNGRPLGDINVDRLALTNLANAGSVSVELLRNGQTLTITTRIPQALR
jgi:general secretion pathway protein C